MGKLSVEILSSFASALDKLKGFDKRNYAAELAEKFFDKSARKVERALPVGREAVELGLKERETGIRCVEAFHQKGRKKKKN